MRKKKSVAQRQILQKFWLLRVLNKISMWCCFILPFSTFYTAHILRWSFFSTIFRLFTRKCLFVRLKLKFKCSPNQLYIMNSLILLFGILHIQSVLFVLFFSRLFCYHPEKVEREKIALRTAYLCIAKWANYAYFLNVICLSFTISFLSHICHWYIYIIYICANTCDILLCMNMCIY